MELCIENNYLKLEGEQYVRHILDIFEAIFRTNPKIEYSNLRRNFEWLKQKDF